MSPERQRRIEELKPLVAERQAQRDRLFQEQVQARMRDEAEVFLSGLSSLQLLGWLAVTEAVSAPYGIRGKIFLSGQPPLKRIWAGYPTAVAEELFSWLQDCQQSFNTGQEYFIAFGEFFGYTGWANVRVLDSDRWLFEVWSQTDFKNIVVLSADQSAVLFIYNDEDSYEVYQGQTAELVALTRPPMSEAEVAAYAAHVKWYLEERDLNNYLIVEKPGQRATIYDQIKQGREWFIEDEVEHR